MTAKRGTPRKPAAKKKPAAPASAAKKPPAKKPPAKKPPRRRTRASARKDTVLVAVDRDLAAVAKLDKELAHSALAANARAMAREIDNADNSATSKAACARSLNDTLERIRALAPKTGTQDGVDDLRDYRAHRLARGAKA